MASGCTPKIFIGLLDEVGCPSVKISAELLVKVVAKFGKFVSLKAFEDVLVYLTLHLVVRDRVVEKFAIISRFKKGGDPRNVSEVRRGLRWRFQALKRQTISSKVVGALKRQAFFHGCSPRHSVISFPAQFDRDFSASNGNPCGSVVELVGQPLISVGLAGSNVRRNRQGATSRMRWVTAEYGIDAIAKLVLGDDGKEKRKDKRRQSKRPCLI